MLLGWMQAAFLDELQSDVCPIDVGGTALIGVRKDGDTRIFDARCPHRGAHLGFGGRLDGEAVVCGFHGHRVRLGSSPSALFCVEERPSLTAAAGLFVRLGAAPDTGLADCLGVLHSTHHVVPGFQMQIAVPAEYVIENVFDADHFSSVHGLDRRPRLDVRTTAAGHLVVEGTFEMARPNGWQAGAPGGSDRTGEQPFRTPFRARVYSPYVVVTELGTPPAHVVITSATPQDGGCRVRVTAALPRRPSSSPTVREVASLLNGSRTAFEQDAIVWEHLDTATPPRWTEGDRPVRAFRDFCRQFSVHSPSVRV